MTTLLVQQNPVSSEFVSFEVARQPLAQERATPVKAQAPIGVVVTGDNHLSPALPRLSPQRRAERRQRLRTAFDAAARYAIEHGARLFAHVGDLFDSPAPSNQDRAFVAQTLARLRRAGVTCVAISGNHDTPRMQTESGGESPLHVYAGLDGLFYFAETNVLRPRLFQLEGLHVAIAGLSNNPSSPPGSDPLATASLDDEDAVLPRADVGLLMLHAGIEGLCQPNEGERIVTRASIEALPTIFRAVVGGHIHRFGCERQGDRLLVVSGATERMEFGHTSGSAGFAWLELTRDGVVRAEHIRIQEQPRADLLLHTSQLWPEPNVAGIAADVARGETMETLADVLPGSGAMLAADAGATSDALAVIHHTLAGRCTPETMVRLRLTGPLTRDQYHQLASRTVLLYGQQHAFSFDLDMRGLVLREPERLRRSEEHAGPVVPALEIQQLAEDRVAAQPGADPRHVEDVRAAAALLLARLQAAGDREGAQ
ncbi:MAG TPA: metallophosphoesterase [Ktedonobacterales bacterium]|nr:metallophosphoesterase [Ktedonobacterales bacterium]